MKRHLSILLLFALAAPALLAAEQGPDLSQARRLWLQGKYAEAAEIYAPQAKANPEATVGLARCFEAQGKTDDAMKVLQAAGEHGAVYSEMARLAFERGDYQAASKHAEKAVALDRDQLQARWIRAEVLRTAGRLEEADKAYRDLITYYNTHDVKQAEALRWIGLAAAQYARWNRLSDQFHFLVNELYPDAAAAEPDFWPAHYEAGVLFLEKHNRADAARELKAALEINSQAAEVHAALAFLALEEHEMDQAQASLARALEINPRLLEAWLGKAELAWANFDAAEAMRLLEQEALPLNPVCEETLGRLAACYVLKDGLAQPGQSTRYSRLAGEVTGRNPAAGEFYFALAVWLADRNRFAEAEQSFQEAIRRMPQLVGPHGELGLLYMRTGQESAARETLEEAFRVDPFNVRVKNSLEVLDVLDTMETLPAGQCVLRFEASQDKLLARYASPRVEAMYRELCDKFGYRPTEKPLVEIFSAAQGNSGHSWFSARMIGLPYLGTVAASTGRIVAMVSPNEADLGARFNWAQVLKHELVHVVTLQQTGYNVPHWFTEGLAVWCEGHPRPAEWNTVLAARLAKGDLFNLETINFGFTRPDSSDDWNLAYCQSELYVEYMLEGRSPEVLKQMLAAYAENLSTGEAVQKVLGVSQADFEKGYVEYLRKLVAAMRGLEPVRAGSFADLRQAHERDPENADLAADLAYACLRRGAFAEAGELAEAARRKQPKHPLAVYVAARLLAREGKTPEAAQLLDECLDPQKPEPRILNLLASLRLKEGKRDEAIRLYELGAKSDPENIRWVQSLARIYLESGDDAKLAELLPRLAQADPADLVVRKKLLQMALAKKDYPAAVQWANQALDIDVSDAEVHWGFAESLAGSHNDIGAVEEFQIAVELSPDNAAWRMDLARAYLKVGKPQQARQALEALLKIEPDHPEAGPLLEKLEEQSKP